VGTTAADAGLEPAAAPFEQPPQAGRRWWHRTALCALRRRGRARAAPTCAVGGVAPQAQIAEATATISAVKAEVASGIVGSDVGATLRKRLYAASIRATAGDKARASSFRQSKAQVIRNAVQFNGPCTSWPNLPRASLAVVERHLEAIEHEAVFLGRTAAKAKQGTLPLN